MSFKEACEIMGKDEAFRATVYAMNTLLISRGIYSTEDFEKLFCEHAKNFQNGFKGSSAKRSGTLREAVHANL
jgi:hypothetical protein